MTNWIAAAGLLAVLVGAVWLGWRLKRDEAIQERLDALKDKKEVDDEVDSLSPADLDRRFKRWMR